MDRAQPLFDGLMDSYQCSFRPVLVALLCATVTLTLIACGTDQLGSSAIIDMDVDDDEHQDSPSGVPRDDNPTPMDENALHEESVEFPRIPSAVKTVFTSLNPIQAGGLVNVECHVLDEQGDRIHYEDHPDFELAYGPQSSFTRDSDGQLIAVRAGQATMTCAVPSLGLIDDTPLELVIVPAAPHTVVTHLDRHVIHAGEATHASCEVFDAYDNPIEDAVPELRSSVVGSVIAINDLSATITFAGVYNLSCYLAGAQKTISDFVEVRPSLPANIAISRVPAQNVYGLGQVVSLIAEVVDEYDNIISDARVVYSSYPEGESFGEGRYRYHEEGIYQVAVTVEGPTKDDIELTASTKITVNGHGPDIDCVYPADGSMIHVAPGSSLTIEGKAVDFHGISQASVNGEVVTVLPGGSFSHTIPVQFGVNVIDIIAEDSLGEQNVRTCAFLASNNWAPAHGFLDDSVSLRLTQDAIDDKTQTFQIKSLNDILLKVLNSSGIQIALHDALVAANPLKPWECDQDTFLGCVFRSSVHYLSSYIGGANSTSLTLVNGGLKTVATVRNLGIQAWVAWWAPIIGTSTTTGWVDVDYIRVDLTSDTAIQNNLPRVSLRQINSVDVGHISLNFSGFTGLIIDIVELLFQGMIRDLVRDTIRDYIEQSFNQVLDGLLSSLSISSIDSSFDVPRLDGQGNISLNFSARFSSLFTNSARALFGLGTRMTTSSAHAIPSLGVALPAGAVRLDPVGSGKISAAVHAGVINQALHTLWRGGLFHAQIDQTTFPDSMPEGAQIALEALLPPVAELHTNSQLELSLGALRLSLVLPGLFDDPILISLGARAQTGVEIIGDDLHFYDIDITELYFAPEGISLNYTTRSALESFLRDVIQDLVNEALNSALPALPIPSFTLPSDMSNFGLTPGSQLGLQNPSLSSTSRHVILHSDFGIR